MSAHYAIGGLILAVLCAGFFYWPYHMLRHCLIELAQDRCRRRPVELFLRGMNRVLVLVLLPLLALVLALTSLPDILNTVLAALTWATLLLATFSGVLGWISTFAEYRKNLCERERFDHDHPAPRLQFSTLDLLAGAFCYGGFLAIQTGFGEKFGKDAMELYALSAWLLFATGAGMFFALDVCRRSLDLQRAGVRFLFVSGTAAATGVVFFIPVLLVWRAWRTAMYRGAWSTAQDLHDRQPHAPSLSAGAGRHDP